MLPNLSLRSVCFALALGALLAGCSISPKPEPPASEPHLDFGSLGTLPPNDFGTCLITGGPGAVDAKGAIVRAYNLDDAQAPVEALVGEDGSFELDVFLSDGDELRLQVHGQDGARSKPLDVLVPQCGQPLVASTRALGECLLLAPSAELEVSAAGAVRVENRCSASVQLEQPSLRRSIAGLQAGQGATWPATLAPGSALTVQITLQPSDVFEEIVFIEASTPQHDRRPVTVFAPGP